LGPLEGFLSNLNLNFHLIF